MTRDEEQLELVALEAKGDWSEAELDRLYYLSNPTMTPWTVELGNLFGHYAARARKERGG